MKNLPIVLSLTMLIFLYAACKKKGSVTPVTMPTVDSTKKADTAKQVSGYPYADKYVGWLNSYFTDGLKEDERYGIDSPLVFYVEYHSKDSMSFWDSGYNAQLGVVWTPGYFINGNNSGFSYIAGQINKDSTFTNGTIRLVNDSFYVYSSYPETFGGPGSPGTLRDTFKGKIVLLR